jgi:aminoglycoside phosphotransferase (APT) family kinase protein
MDLSNASVIARRTAKTVYRDGNYVIKVMNPEYPASDVLNEAHNLAIVAEIGFKVPALAEVVKIDERWAIITEYIDGKTVGQLFKENPEQTGPVMERFVDIQLKMHTYTAPKLRHHFDKFNAKISATGLDATTRYELHARLNGLPRHNKLCHGDYTPGNVIITPDNEAYVIDWSHATQGNASADAARTYLRFMLAGHEARAEAYMDLFCKKSDTARQYVNKWLAICAASQLVKKVPEERELLIRWADVVEYA